MRIVTCHSTHEHCGIAEYGRQLDDAIESLDKRPVVRTYDTLRSDDLGDGRSLLVHFEPILNKGKWPEFLSMMQAIRAYGSHVVFCCHYWDPGVFSPMALRVVDRFVLHRRYKGAQHPKFVEIPLGCPLYTPTVTRTELREYFGIPFDAKVLTTIGFLAAWKKTPEVIDGLLEQCEDEKVFLQILMPRPFLDPDGDRLEAEVREVIARYPRFENRVVFSTEFRPEAELLDRIYLSDYGFLFHGQDTGSVSAAAKQFVSARVPLVTTHSTHAADLQGGVHRVDSFDTFCFAHDVLKVAAGSTESYMLLYEGIVREYERINMTSVARRYLDLFRSL